MVHITSDGKVVITVCPRYTIRHLWKDAFVKDKRREGDKKRKDLLCLF
jgi:hypothetical protein